MAVDWLHRCSCPTPAGHKHACGLQKWMEHAPEALWSRGSEPSATRLRNLIPRLFLSVCKAGATQVCAIRKCARGKSSGGTRLGGRPKKGCFRALPRGGESTSGAKHAYAKGTVCKRRRVSQTR